MDNSNKDIKTGTGTGSGNRTRTEIDFGEEKVKTEAEKWGNKLMVDFYGESKSPSKRGRKRKELSEEEKNQKDQDKFFVDVSRDKEQRQLIQNLLAQANNKSYGREIILKDLVLIALPKLTTKDLEKVQEHSLSEMERVQRALDEHNKKAEIKLSLGEFLVKKLSLQ